MLTKEQYHELLFLPACSLYVIEHLDVYQVHHYTPEIFFAKKSNSFIFYKTDNDPEPIPFIIILAPGTLLSALDNCNVEAGERIVVSYRKAIEDRIGYAFVSLQKRKNPLQVIPIDSKWRSV